MALAVMRLQKERCGITAGGMTMKRQWKELTMLTFALLLSIVGCVPSATPTPSVVQVTKVVETAKAVEVACETVKFTIRTDSTTAGGILATGTLTRCGTPLEKVEIKGKNRGWFNYGLK
jgi:hypothetical protein